MKKSLSELKEQEKKIRRDLIVDAAERIFAAKPFDKVSIRDIAKEAGISHALIYHYFPDQQALFLEAFLRGCEEITGLIRSALDDGAGIEEIGDLFVTYLTEHDQYFRMMTHFMLDGNLDGELLERLNEMERRLFDELDRLFTGEEGGKQARLFSHALFASLNGIVITFRNYPGRDRDEVLRHMLKLGRAVAGRFTTAKRRTAPRRRRVPDRRG